MSKFRIRWTQTVTEYWYVDVEAESAEEAEEMYHDGNYLNTESELDESIVEFSDFDSVEKLKTNKKGKK